MLSFEQIKELIELVAENRLEGLVIERSGFKVKIEGRKPDPVVTMSEPARVVAAASPAPEAAEPGAGEETPATETAAESATPEVPENAAVVTSPIVGTFYAGPNPESPPYVRVGDRVEVGQVLCIVEAMKLMNEIESDVAGVIVKILPKNAQPVEFGEPLFAIQAD